MAGLRGVGCTVLVSSIAASNGLIILGDPFIRSHYVSIDYTALTVSLATTSNPPELKSALSFWAIYGVMFVSIVASAVGFNF